MLTGLEIPTFWRPGAQQISFGQYRQQKSNTQVTTSRTRAVRMRIAPSGSSFETGVDEGDKLPSCCADPTLVHADSIAAANKCRCEFVVPVLGCTRPPPLSKASDISIYHCMLSSIVHACWASRSDGVVTTFPFVPNVSNE